MAERQPSWDKYEAAILLEGILASMKGELTRSDAVKAVSHDLRAMAVHRGIEIDAVYRNTNGISFQMKSMESAYLGRTVFKPATRLLQGLQVCIMTPMTSIKITEGGKSNDNRWKNR